MTTVVNSSHLETMSGYPMEMNSSRMQSPSRYTTLDFPMFSSLGGVHVFLFSFVRFQERFPLYEMEWKVVYQSTCQPDFSQQTYPGHFKRILTDRFCCANKGTIIPRRNPYRILSTQRGVDLFVLSTGMAQDSVIRSTQRTLPRIMKQTCPLKATASVGCVKVGTSLSA